MSDNDKPFSERTGLVPPKAMQTDGLDQAARTALYNVINDYLDKGESRLRVMTWLEIGLEFFNLRSDNIFSDTSLRPPHQVNMEEWESMFHGTSSPKISEQMHLEYENIFKGEWYRVFDLIEFIFSFIEEKKGYSFFDDFAEDFPPDINRILKKKNVGYQFIDGKFIPITNEEEVQAIEQAMASPYENAREHIKKAITRFADRQKPDYANSIAESIKAVESLAIKITGENNFDKAINKLKENGVKLHPQFEKAIKNMYQFTSDDDGIRHGGTGEPLQCDQATARYMLITCSAIVNFITDKAAKP